MSRRARDEGPVLSLDSFLDIVTNVVGVLILVAVVTVLGASDIGVPAGASALQPPRRSAARALFELSGDEVFFIDEAGNAQRIQEAAWRFINSAPGAVDVAEMLREHDIGDRTHRVRAELLSDRLGWEYVLRPGARGEPASVLHDRGSQFQRRLGELPAGGFAYFVVHDDSFAVFRKAREVARSMGIAVGWHPVEGRGPIRLSSVGSLGKRVQ